MNGLDRAPGARRGGGSLALIALLALLLGLACLNYAKAEGVEGRAAWARRRCAPPPSAAIHVGGALLTVAGAGGVGFAAGRRRRSA